MDIPQNPDFVLVVRNAFGAYRRGDIITDPVEIERILASDNARDVVKS